MSVKCVVSPGCTLTGIVTIVVIVVVVIIIIVIITIQLAGKHSHFVFAHRFPSRVPAKQKLVLNGAERTDLGTDGLGSRPSSNTSELCELRFVSKPL